MAGYYPLTVCLDQATARQTLNALSVVKMYQASLSPDESTVLADLDAAEADFDGYSAATLTAWGDPILAPESGYATYSPSFQFTSAAPNTTLNSIGGLYLVSAGGDLLGIFPFDTPLPMGAVGQGYTRQLAEYFPTGYTG